MAFLTALLGAAGGYGAGRQQRFQNEQDQQRLKSETEYQTAETHQAQEDAQIRAAQAGYQFDPSGKLQPIPLRAGYAPAPKNATGEALYNWAAGNYSKALAQNDPIGMQTWGDAVAKYSAGYQKTTSGDVNEARVPLLKAQTDYWRNWKTRLQMGYNAALQRAGASQAAAMQRTYANIASRQDIANRSMEERSAIAMQTALNLAQYHNQDEAYRAAVDQANRQDTLIDEAYKGQVDAAVKNNQPIPQMPALPPISISTGVPVVTVNEVVPGPNGTLQVKKVSTGGGAPGTLPVKQETYEQAAAMLSKAAPGEIPQRIDMALKGGFITQATAARLRKHFGLTASGASGF